MGYRKTRTFQYANTPSLHSFLYTICMPPPGGGVGWFLPGSQGTSLRGLLPTTLNLARPILANSISIVSPELTGARPS